MSIKERIMKNTSKGKASEIIIIATFYCMYLGYQNTGPVLKNITEIPFPFVYSEVTYRPLHIHVCNTRNLFLL
ncbi:hypothetical protein XELAEV_18030503mg [Xenopus laevis]|uniref:Uncharacterized protein n=1 Tax=Xenopus laevis TaxID=8355 RepID=A0A974CKX3_XENLA|nr:hypothetical protein XELAEV_18030503mg [Xenopus laevis]